MKSEMNPDQPLVLTRCLVVANTVLAFTQTGYFMLAGRGVFNTLAAVALIMAVFRVRRWSSLDSGYLRSTGLLLATQTVLFAAYTFSGAAETPQPLMHAAVFLSYVAVLTGLLLTFIVRRLSPEKAFIMTASMALSLLAAETVLTVMTPAAHAPDAPPPGPRWTGSWMEDPVLGYRAAPGSIRRSYFPDNPRGYFHADDQWEKTWQLHVAGDHAGRLEFTDGKTMRVVVERAASEPVWDLQLSQAGLPLKKEHQYVLTFIARADKNRFIGAGVSQAQPPRRNLGLYSTVDLTPAWKTFTIEFSALEDEANAHIHFNIGGYDPAVKIREVTLKDLTDGATVTAEVPAGSYYVSYRYNAQGCRGPDYAIPKPDGVVRILALGDSYTMGVGVHEEDTFTVRLQEMLNEANTDQRYEVINSGLAGYDTRQERLYYESYGTVYQPDIVLLVMVWNDDMSYLEEVERGYIVKDRTDFGSSFRLLNRLENAQNQRPVGNFSNSIREIITLNEKTRAQGARLAIVIFRDIPEGGDSSYYGQAWQQLVTSVTEGIKDTDIPMLDLREALFREHSYPDLVVHPTVDKHPNEIAHGIAAAEIRDFLHREHLIKPERHD